MLSGVLKKRLFARDLAELRGFRGWLVRAVRILWFAAREFRRDFCLERAASLAFATLISLIPLAVLLLGLAVQFGVGDRFIHFARAQLFPLLAPDFQLQLSEWLEGNIARNAFSQSVVSAVGLLAIFILVFTALGIINAAERSFNRVWKVQGTRSYLQKLATFWVVLSISPFIITASVWIGDFLVPADGVIAKLADQSLVVSTLYRLLVPTVVGFFGFTVLYRYLPAARVRMGSAVLGGIVAAALWEISTQSFSLYVGRTQLVRSFYGSLAVVPIFLVWVYLNWLIVLGGCELAYAHQNFLLLSERLARSERTRQLPLAFVGIHLLEKLGHAFQAGRESPDADEVARALSTSSETVDEAGRRLVGAGILILDQRDERYALKRAPAAVSLAEVMALLPGEEVPKQPPSDRDGIAARPQTQRLFLEAEDLYRSAFRGKTLLDLLEPAACGPLRDAGEEVEEMKRNADREENA